MLFPLAWTLFLVLRLINLSRAGNVTVHLNDPRLVSRPPHWSGFSAFSPLCGGTRWTHTAGESVSLTFTGVAVSVNLLVEYRGAIGQIMLDNKVVSQVNTHKAGVVNDQTCEAISWNSNYLPLGSHNITVTHQSSSTYVGPVYLWMYSFVYMPSAQPAAAGSATKGNSNTIIIASATAGGVVGLIIITVIGICLYRRSKATVYHPPTTRSILDVDTATASTTPIIVSRYNGSLPQGRPTSSYYQSTVPNSQLQGRTISSYVQSTVPSSPPQVPLYISNPAEPSPPLSAIHKARPESSVNNATETIPNSPSSPCSDIVGDRPNSPPSPSSDTVGDRQLSQEQMNLVRTLVQRNVPTPVLVTVIESMTSPSGQPSSPDAQNGPPEESEPPPYDFESP